MNVLDTSAWIEYLNGTEKGLNVKNIIDNGIIYTSSITLAELSKWVHENNGDIFPVIEKVKTSSTLILLEENILVESGKTYNELRKTRKKISLIDSIIYTTCLIHGLNLITKDSDFKDLPNVKSI
ncbi:MAG: PIN domain-containing protein [Nanoarchaeota archaeon]